MLFKDTWIEDICWASPHTLALAPATKTSQPNDYSITLIDINPIDRVSNNNNNINKFYFVD